MQCCNEIKKKNIKIVTFKRLSEFIAVFYIMTSQNRYATNVALKKSNLCVKYTYGKYININFTKSCFQIFANVRNQSIFRLLRLLHFSNPKSN